MTEITRELENRKLKSTQKIKELVVDKVIELEQLSDALNHVNEMVDEQLSMYKEALAYNMIRVDQKWYTDEKTKAVLKFIPSREITTITGKVVTTIDTVSVSYNSADNVYTDYTDEDLTYNDHLLNIAYQIDKKYEEKGMPNIHHEVNVAIKRLHLIRDLLDCDIDNLEEAIDIIRKARKIAKTSLYEEVENE